MIKRADDETLFIGDDLQGICTQKVSEMLRTIDSIQQSVIVAGSLEDLVRRIVEGFTLQLPVLRVADTVLDKVEVDTDVSGDRDRMFLEPGPHFIKATQVTFAVPFDGDGALFFARPPAWTSMMPRGTVADAELRLNFITDQEDPTPVQALFDREVRKIEEYLASTATTVRIHNSELPSKARQRLEARRQKLQGDEKLMQGLRFPLRERPGAPRTFEPPAVRRKVIQATHAPPLSPTSPTLPAEPAPLAMADYEHILGVCSSMVHVMERSPKAFAVLGEEDIRWHFLVQLNGHYEGMGAAEAFNFEGKTDILIRHGTKNLFIAECKVWSGEVALSKAIDQVLGYLSWRDTKAAVFVFNRNKDFTAVIDKMKAAVRVHPAFLREVEYASESGMRVVLRRPDDAHREILLTLLAFDIPQ